MLHYLFLPSIYLYIGTIIHELGHALVFILLFQKRCHIHLGVTNHSRIGTISCGLLHISIYELNILYGRNYTHIPYFARRQTKRYYVRKMLVFAAGLIFELLFTLFLCHHLYLVSRLLILMLQLASIKCNTALEEGTDMWNIITVLKEERRLYRRKVVKGRVIRY